MKLWASEFLTKPIDSDGLSARVRSILRARGAEQKVELLQTEFNSMLLHLPEEAISVAVISNCEQLSSQEVAFAIARVALEPEPSPTPAAVAK